MKRGKVEYDDVKVGDGVYVCEGIEIKGGKITSKSKYAKDMIWIEHQMVNLDCCFWDKDSAIDYMVNEREDWIESAVKDVYWYKDEIEKIKAQR